MDYRLKHDEAVLRARRSALASTFGALAPAGVAVAMVGRLDLTPRTYTGVAVGLLVLLAVGRCAAAYRQILRHLEAFSVAVLATDAIAITTRLRSYPLDPSSIVRVIERGGALGGLQLVLAAGWDGSEDSPESVDIPAGGVAYGELRAAIEAIRPIERPRKRTRVVRVAIAVGVVVGIFFLPFVPLDGFGGSKLVPLALALLAWTLARTILRR